MPVNENPMRNNFHSFRVRFGFAEAGEMRIVCVIILKPLALDLLRGAGAVEQAEREDWQGARTPPLGGWRSVCEAGINENSVRNNSQAFRVRLCFAERER